MNKTTKKTKSVKQTITKKATKKNVVKSTTSKKVATKKQLSQIEKVTNYITKYGKITSTKAKSMSVTSLPLAVYKLRKKGYNIEVSSRKVSGKNVTTYTLNK